MANQTQMNLPNLLFVKVLIIAITLVAPKRLMSQHLPERTVSAYTREQGLSHNVVTGIAQDSIGYIWIATASGLNRFNGSSFLQFHAGDDSLSLPAENIRGLVWLDNRRLCAFG